MLYKVPEFFLSVSIVSSPLYIFPSGLPQPADWLMLVFFVAMIVSGSIRHLPQRGYGLIISFGLIVVWVASIQYYWSGLYNSITMLPALYFLYNGLVAVMVLTLISRKPAVLSLLQKSISICLVVCLIGLVIEFVAPNFALVESTKGRVTGFFNNPNQVGYFSVLGIGALAVIDRFEMTKITVILAGYASAVLSLFFVVSLAAFGSAALIIVTIMYKNGFTLKRLSRLVVAAILVLSFVFFSNNLTEGWLEDQFDRRVSVFDRKVSNVEEERNYARVLAFPEYWLLGAGKGSYERFYPYEGNEIHSSIADMFFSYGIIGLILLLSLWYFMIKRANRLDLTVFLAVMLYSATHMGLRFTPFWILLVVIFSITSLKRCESLNRDATKSKIDMC